MMHIAELASKTVRCYASAAEILRYGDDTMTTAELLDEQTRMPSDIRTRLTQQIDKYSTLSQAITQLGESKDALERKARQAVLEGEVRRARELIARKLLLNKYQEELSHVNAELIVLYKTGCRLLEETRALHKERVESSTAVRLAHLHLQAEGWRLWERLNCRQIQDAKIEQDIATMKAGLVAGNVTIASKDKFDTRINTSSSAPLGERNTRIIPQDVKIRVSARDHGRCRQCGSTQDLQYDHIIPWSKGGANTENNVQLLCGPCNRRKGAD